MDRGHLALKEELVVGVDDDGLEIRIGGHEAHVAFVARGEVDSLHRQATVDAGHHDAAVGDLFLTIHQTDVAVEESEANHRLSFDTDIVGGLAVTNEFLVQIEALVLVVTCRRRESCLQPLVIGQAQPLGIFQSDVLGSVYRLHIIHMHRI